MFQSQSVSFFISTKKRMPKMRYFLCIIAKSPLLDFPLMSFLKVCSKNTYLYVSLTPKSEQWKRPCLGRLYRGWNTTQLYTVGIFFHEPWHKDPMMNQPGWLMESRATVFWTVANKWVGNRGNQKNPASRASTLEHSRLFPGLYLSGSSGRQGQKPRKLQSD